MKIYGSQPLSAKSFMIWNFNCCGKEAALRTLILNKSTNHLKMKTEVFHLILTLKLQFGMRFR